MKKDALVCWASVFTFPKISFVPKISNSCTQLVSTFDISARPPFEDIIVKTCNSESK